MMFQNYANVCNCDVALVIITTFCAIWGGQLSRRGRCGGGGGGGVEVGGPRRRGKIKEG
jgi:hypothetical protein